MLSRPGRPHSASSGFSDAAPRPPPTAHRPARRRRTARAARSPRRRGSARPGARAATAADPPTAAITPFTSDPGIDPAELPFFVAGLELTDERLAELGKSFLIDDLHFEVGEMSEPVGDERGARHRHLRRNHRPLRLDAADTRRRGAAERPPADRRRARPVLRRRLGDRLPRPQDRHRAHRQREGGRWSPPARTG